MIYVVIPSYYQFIYHRYQTWSKIKWKLFENKSAETHFDITLCSVTINERKVYTTSLSAAALKVKKRAVVMIVLLDSHMTIKVLSCAINLCKVETFIYVNRISILIMLGSNGVQKINFAFIQKRQPYITWQPQTGLNKMPQTSD